MSENSSDVFNLSFRKRRTKHDYWQMPDEFFAHFGSPREFSNAFRPRTTTYFTYSYKVI